MRVKIRIERHVAVLHVEFRIPLDLGDIVLTAAEIFVVWSP